MRIAWYSNAPWAPSGYGCQTKLVTERMVEAGHDVCILANCGLEAGVLNWGDIPVFPRGNGMFDGATIRRQAKQFDADILISFYDVWMLSADMMGARWVPWYPVDREPFPAAVRDKLTGAFYPIACSQWGYDAAQELGIGGGYIPCCVDMEQFKPVDKAEARKKMGLDFDGFIVGIVADNKGYPSRKALAEQVEAFARFAAKHDDAKLYLHTCLSGQRGGIDLSDLIIHLDLEQKILTCDQGAYNTTGLPSDYMVAVYNAINVLSAVSMDEGFGVPIIEAQACGIPVIVGEWTAMPELLGAGWAVTKAEAHPVWTPSHKGYHYAPGIDAIAARLELAYSADPEFMVPPAIELAKQYEADTVFETYWEPMLEELQERAEMSPSFEEIVT